MQLKDFLQPLAAHPRLTPDAVQSAHVLLVNGVQYKVIVLLLVPVFRSHAALQYPLSKEMLGPTSMPKYYECLVQGYEKSAQGIRRPWWQVFFGIWR